MMRFATLGRLISWAIVVVVRAAIRVCIKQLISRL